jgi:uncharacterized membrane protein YuzA (DUF378 family)
MLSKIVYSVVGVSALYVAVAAITNCDCKK